MGISGKKESAAYHAVDASRNGQIWQPQGCCGYTPASLNEGPQVDIGFLGTGACRPQRRVTTVGQETAWNIPPGTLEPLCGVRERAYASDDETAVSLGTAAAREAIDSAGLSPADIDLVLSASAVPYQLIPATAPLYQRALEIPHAAAFDINATCLGFLAAADVARALLSTGRYRRALIVSSEIASRGLPWHDEPETAALFGDGAGAAILGPVADGLGIRAVRMETFPEAYESCQVQTGGSRHDLHADPDGYRAHAWFRMEGKALYRLTARHIRPFVERAVASAGWALGDVDVVVPHQASRGGIEHAVRLLGLERAKVVDILADHGNQVAASLPTALHHARATGRIQPGAKVLLVGTSAGVSLGALAWAA